MSTFKSSYSNIQVSAETVSRSSSIVAGNIPIFNLSNRMVDSGVLLSTITGGTGTSGVSITGGTYSNGTLVLENSTGGTVSISGFTTFDTYVTGGTYNSTTGVLSLINNSGNTFTVGGFALLNNGVYNYTTWSTDTISGATRQAIANEFNNIINNLNTYTGNTNTTLTNLQNELNGLSSYTQSISSTTQSQVNILQSEITTLSAFTSSYTSSTNTTLTNIQNELNSLSSYTQSISSTTQNQVNTLQNEINVLSGSVITLSGYTFQNIYNNSLTIPQITTNSVLDGLAIQNGSGSLDNITRLFKGVSSGGTLTSIIRADGYISGTSIYYNNLLSTGFLTYTDSNILAAFQSSVNNYNQIILQNTNTGASASTDYIVSNNLSTSNSYYGDFGMNGSGFTGNTSFNLPNAVYLTSTSTDLLIGTTTNNPIHFAVNGGNDSLIINSNGVSATTQIVSPSHLINGTSGAGYLELLSQSSSPTGITGNLIISANSSAVPGLQLTTQNAANSVTINQNLVFPNASTTITFPSPTNGSSDSVGYLNTTQTWTGTNTHIAQDIYNVASGPAIIGQSNTGSNASGGTLVISSGLGTGAGTAPFIYLQTPTVLTGTGNTTTQQTPSSRWIIGPDPLNLTVGGAGLWPGVATPSTSNYILRYGSAGTTMGLNGSGGGLGLSINGTIKFFINANGNISTNSTQSGNYNSTNATGSTFTPHLLIDPANSTTAGISYSFDPSNGFGFNQGNGTSRIQGAKIQPINLTSTAGSEAMDLGIYTQNTGLTASLKFQLGQNLTLFKTGVTSTFNSMVGGIYLNDASTQPTAAPSTGGYLYSSAGTLNWYSSLNTGGTNSAFAILGNTQTFSGVNTFASGNTNIFSLSIYDQVATIYRTALSSTSSGSLTVGGVGFTNITITSNLIFPNCYSNSIQGMTSGGNMLVGPSIYTGSVYFGPMAGTLSSSNSGPVGSVNLTSTSTSGTGPVPGINIFTGNQTNITPGIINPITIYTGNVSSGTSGSVLCDVGTGINRGGWAFFNGQVTPTWNGLQRGIYIGNATMQPTGGTSNGFYMYSWNGGLSIMASGSTLSTIDTNGFSTTSGLLLGYIAITTSYTAQTTNYTIDCSGNTITVTLPSSVGLKGKIYVIKNSGVGTTTINTTSSQTIDGASTKVINTQYDGIMVQSDGSNWKIISTF